MKTIKKMSLILMFMILIFSTKSNAVQSNFNYNTVNTEKIYSYQSEIYINEDASMIVEETIKVYAGGNNIKKGIYRDFPTKYKDKLGNNYNVGFEVLEVLKDGKSEPYQIEKQKNGVRVRIGDANKTLRPGYYTYTIKYETNRQIGYFDDHDELYWNVTGNGWDFTISEAKAIVHLPDNVNMKKVNFEAYTGKQGSTEKEYIANKNEYNNTVTFSTTDNLFSQEGLTIVVGFEKGLVHQPTTQEYIMYWFEDNRGVLVGLCCAVVIIIYCFITWCKVGKDPKKDIIIPRYNPPDGLSPAEVKFIDSMGKYDKVFEASILNLAVKGYIKIENEEEKIFGIKSNKMTLIKQEKELGNDITEDEKDIYKTLPSVAKLEYSSSLQRKLETMQIGQRKFLKNKFNGQMYKRNSGLVMISVIMSIIVAIISVMFSNNAIEEMFMIPFMSIWLTIWTIGIVAMLTKGNGAKKIGVIIFAIPFLIGEIVGIGTLIHFIGIGLALLILLLVVINVVYAFLIKAYTEEGRRIKDEIEGFKLFIKTASEDEIRNQTPETFDKYFPYAYVLGLENEWSKKFESLLAEYNYEPTWCTGMYHGSAFRATVFTSSFSSSFRSGISSASVHPSSSGGGSGFSSGGGGRRILWWRRPEAGGGGGW